MPTSLRPLVVLAAAFSLLLVGCGQKEEEPRAKHVFIISFDQGAPHNLLESEMPTLRQMVKEGAHTWEAYTIVPSITLPSHVSMLTGLGIQKHQILWNEFEPEKGMVKVPTIFKLAKERGMVTALFAGKNKFRTLMVPKTLDVAVIPENPSAESMAKAFTAEVGRIKPNLCFIHFAEPDTMGHRYGVNSPEKMKALAEADAALKTILEAIDAAGLTESSVILMSADHGGHDRSAEENAKRAADGKPHVPGTHGSPATSDVVIPWIAWGKGVKPDYTIRAPVVTYDTAATALWLLDIPLPEGLWGRPVTSAFQER